MDFQHKRYFAIQLRKFAYRWRTNSPFLSQGTFRSLCDLEILSLNDVYKIKKWANAPKSAFVKSDLLEIFLSEHGACRSIKVLFTGSSDRNFDQFIDLPNNIEMWFCQNSAISDNKRIFTLPIGLEDISLGRAGRKRFFRFSPEAHRNTSKVFVPPMSPTNPVRRPVVLECRENPLFDVFIKLMDEEEYFPRASGYKFVLCLEGRGYENHRIWETLYQGNFPVMLSSTWSKSLAYLNLPILIVDSVSELTREKLDSFLLEHGDWNPETCSVLWAPFWRNIAKGRLETLQKVF